MKQKLKLIFAITLAGILLFACQVDKELTNDSLYQENGMIMHKKFEDLIKETQFKTAFEKINVTVKGSFMPKGNNTSRTVMESQYGFTIEDSPANVVVAEGITSYTFLIKRENTPNNVFENLIINLEPNKEPLAYLHKFTSSTSNNNEPIKIENFTGQKDLTKIEYNINQSSNKIQATEGCRIVREWFCGGPGNHTRDVEECGGHYIVSVKCTNGSSNQGNTTGGSTTSGSTTGTSSNGNAEAPTVVTAPVGPKPKPSVLDAATDPCIQVKPLLDPAKANLKQKIIDLQPCAGQSAGECATSLEKNAAGNYNALPLPSNPTGLAVNVPDGGDVYGSIHTHPLFPAAIPMFSWGDVHSLFQTYDKSDVHNNNNVTVILVIKTSDNNGNLVDMTYALTINNPANFLATMDAELNAMTGTLEQKKEDKNKELKLKYDFIGRGYENWEKGFLNYFKDYNISLMKANSALTGWNELKLDNSTLPYNQQIVTPNPCN